MPSGRTHDFVTYLMIIPTFVVAYAVFELNFGQSFIVALGMWFGGIFLSPDLDIKSRPFYRWGPVRFIWWPYQWAIKHRSSASHGIVLAPMLRLVYITAICILGYQLALFSLHQHGWFLDINAKHAIVNFFKHNSERFVYLGIGIWLGSLFHVMMDFIGSNVRFKLSRR